MSNLSFINALIDEQGMSLKAAYLVLLMAKQHLSLNKGATQPKTKVSKANCIKADNTSNDNSSKAYATSYGNAGGSSSNCPANVPGTCPELSHGTNATSFEIKIPLWAAFQYGGRQ